jgi:hypothetical protein
MVMKTRLATVDKARFGPWAVVTGSSSGIGREFARQLAANGIDVVLVARREELLREIGRELSTRYGVEHRVVGLDLTEPDFLDRLARATADLDVGLVVSNAGAAMPGEFLSHDLEALRVILRLHGMATLEVVHHFGGRLARRGRGGMILVGASGAQYGIPNHAHAGATKAYILALGKGLHPEFARRGVNLCVLLPGLTDTPVLGEFGFDPGTSPLKPMTVERCVVEGLDAVAANRVARVPGRLNRLIATVIPARVTSMMMGRMIGQGVARVAAERSNDQPKP